MSTNKKCKKVLVAGLSAFMTMSLMQMPLTVQADEIAEKAVDGVTTIGKIASLSDITVSDNVVDIATTNNGEKIKITFVSDDVLRLNVEPKGQFVEEPSTARPDYVAKMLVKPISEYEGVQPVVTEDDSSYVIATAKVTLVINKEDSKMQMINNETQETVWSEKAPLEYGNGKTRQTLNEDEKEYFYGGGFQNGYFSHKNTAIKIDTVATSGNWGDGMVTSPLPFYMSTKGYGVMRYTWKNGVYDFGADDPSTTVTTHNEERFDAIYFLGDMPKVIDDYTDLTGKPVMLPEYSYYLGHANCYNRDYWVEDENGKYEFDGKRYREVGSANPGGNAFQETLNDSPVSARTMLDWYQNKDMPFGWFLPNDGYGCGYGQSDRGQISGQADAVGIDDNIENLRQFTDYANNKGVEVGLWTQSDLAPREYAADGSFIPVHLRRDVKKEVNVAGVRAVKTDVAWVGSGFSMALNSVKTAADTIEEAQARPFVVSLFGWNGTQRYSTVWSGDQAGSKWEYIRFHIPSYIGSGLSAQPYVGSDMDGIYGGGDAIIQTRDYQWKAFTPVMIDMDGWGSSIKHPDTFKGEYSSINRLYLKTKAEMTPYNYSNTFEANQTAMPLVRAMVLEYPDDPYTYGADTKYQYMWGENLLVAPIYQDTASDKAGNDIRNNIYLPDEDQVWIDYFNGDQYQGGKIINNFDAPVWKLPLFVKNGAIIPMAEENNSANELKGASPRIFEVWPSGETDFSLFEDDGISTEFYNGSYATTNITSSAPKSGDGTAVIKVEATNTNDQDYEAVTKYDQVRDTQFVVNVQKAPSAISAVAGSDNLTFKAVNSQEEFDNATENVYFYNEAPNLNKYNLDSETFADTKIITTPKVYVKVVNVDVMQDLTLTVDGFNNTQEVKSDGKTEAPATPNDFMAIEEQIGDTSIGLKWSAVDGETNGASYYEIRVGGETGFILSNINKTDYVHEDLKQATEYTYEIRAVNSAGVSAWTQPIVVTTQLDRYRNVIPNLSISSPNSASGYNTNVLINRDFNDMWFSSFNNDDPNVAKGEKEITMDFKEVYNMDKIVLTGVDGYSGGNPKIVSVETSIDGIHYKKALDKYTLEWSNKQLEAVIPMEGSSMRHVRIVIHQPYNSWIALSEVMPFKVEGSKSSPVGDVNGDRIVDDGDLSFLNNYAGINSNDVLWASQVSQADFNGNNLIDGYDLAFVASAIYGTGSSQQNVAGNIIAIPSKTSLLKDEEFEIDILGVNMTDVNAFSFELTDVNNNFTVNGPAVKTGDIEHMIVYPRSMGNRVTLAASNYGRYGNRLNGTIKLATVKAIAKTDTTFDMELTNALVVGSGMMEKNAIGTFVDPGADFPEIDTNFKQLVNGLDFNVSSTTPDKFQPGCGPELIADGDLNTLSELKWSAGAEMPLNWTFDMPYEKEIDKVTVYKRANGNGSLKKIEMKAYLNGEIVYEEIRDDIEKGAESATFTFDKPIKADKVEFNALDSHQASESTKFMTVREIVISGRNNSPVTGIEPDDANVYDVKPNAPFIFKANVTPANATNKYYTVNVSDPDLLKVSRMQDNSTGDISYILTANEVKEDTAVNVIVTSVEDTSIKFEKEIIIRAQAQAADKSALETLYNEVKDIEQGDSTDAAWEQFTKALETAKAVLDKADATQEEINLTKAALQNAYDNLKQTDFSIKEVLAGAIEKANEIIDSVAFNTLAPKVKDLLVSARDQANAIMNDETADDMQVLAAWSKLANALHYADFQANKADLKELIDICAKLNADDYSAGFEAMTLALEAANTVYKNENALQTSINNAHTTLLNAYNALVKNKDTAKETLEDLVVTFDNLIEADADKYCDNEAWKAFITALDAAKAVLSNAEATTSELHTAILTLTNAYEDIRLLPDESILKDLESFIAKVNALDLNTYSSENAAKFLAVANRARMMIQDPNTYNPTILEEIKAIDDIIANETIEQPEDITPDVAAPADPEENVTPIDPAEVKPVEVPTTKGTTKTGDATNIMGMAAMLFASAGMLAKARKKQKKNK